MSRVQLGVGEAGARTFLSAAVGELPTALGVAQTSKSAVSPTSKSADLRSARRFGNLRYGHKCPVISSRAATGYEY